ncbi:MAG: hypothetical protein NTW29_06295 [Bacteroidetes bacterium]|nr:hypothetical protein [Bacteroidota bacterium]
MSNWTKQGSQIFKDGTPTFLKGVCYSPTPIGAATFTPGIGDWFTSPWNAIWERDFPLMKAAGINNIRTYFFWAWTPPNDMSGWNPVPNPLPAVTFDHKPFLDSAAKHGISVTIGLALDGGNIFDNGVPALATAYFNFYNQTLQQLVTLYGTHPAVMGFCLGNEQNNRPRIVRKDFWDKLADMATAARGLLKSQQSQKLLLFAMQNDDPYMFQAVINDTGGVTVPQRFAQIFDAWGLNIYAGMSTTLQDYKNYVVNGTGTILPAIITEWGIPGGKNDASLPPPPSPVPSGTPAARQLTDAEFAANISNIVVPDQQAIIANLSFVAGAQWFEWTDEWWKNGWWESLKPQATPCIQVGSPSADWPDDWWGLNGVAPDPSRTACEGPWNQGANQPYPPDVITARPTLANLTAFYGTIS